jgi:hypothetical protein
MIIAILEDEYVMPEAQNGISELMQLIADKEHQTGLRLDYITVNGQDVYDQIEKFLIDNADSLERVEVNFASIEERIQKILMSTYEYTSNASPLIVQLAEQFYKSPSSENWHSLTQLFDSLIWLNTVLPLLAENNVTSNYNEFSQLSGTLEEIVGNLQAGLENQDHVLIADILKYEINPLYTQLATLARN